MRRIICILMCLSMASVVSALSITNGDFEALGIREDVPDWFDYNVYFVNNQGVLDTVSGSAGTYLRLLHSPADPDSQYMGFVDDDCWAYQSIGLNTGGVPALQIQYDIGAVEGGYPDEPLVPRDLNLTVSIYESDGSFVGSDTVGLDSSDIDGAEGVTLIDSVTVSYPAMEVGQAVTDSVTLQYLSSTSGELFLRFKNNGDGDDETDDRFAIDNVQIVEAPSVVNPLPKDGTEFVAIERTSVENDLFFDVFDEDIVEVDVLFKKSDPNLSSADTITPGGMEIAATGQYTIDLEDELTEDLDWSKDYYWKVLAYEPNGMEVSLKYESPVWNFRTIQEGPLLGDVTPDELAAHPGEDAVFSLSMSSKADTFQWYKYVDGTNDTMLIDGPTGNGGGSSISGATSDTLTVVDCNVPDEGFYYCIGTETASGLTDQSSSGELWIKLLVAYYPFETENGGYTPDVIGGKNMQLMGGASLSDANSLIGKNLWLQNPGNQWARITDNTVADYEDITISCWVNPTTLVDEVDGDRWARVFEFGKDHTEYMFLTMLYRQDDPRQGGLDVARCEFRYYDSEGTQHNPELDVESEIDPGRWYYVAITIEADDDGEGATGRIYLGGEHGTEYESPQVLNVPSPVEITKTYNYIGKYVGYSAPLLNGRIDEFKIYNYVRTSEEIAQDYYDVTGDKSICDMENYDLYEYDFNRNCIVDLSDFAEIAARWLDDYRIFPN